MDVSLLLHANGNLRELGHESTLGYYVRKCRVCLRNGHTPIFNEYNPKLEALRMFADIQTEDDDAYPKFLCSHCDELLQGCLTLQRTAKDTERMLQSCIRSDNMTYHVNKCDDKHNLPFLHANDNLHGLGHESILGYYKRKCRVCLQNGYTPIFNEYNPKLEALRMFADIKIEDYDAFPKFLCNDCDKLLQGCVTLRRTAQNTERKLKSCIHSDNMKIHIDKWDDSCNILEKLDTTEAIDVLNQSLNTEESYGDMLEIMSTAIVNTENDHISQLVDDSNDEMDYEEQYVETPHSNEYVVMLVGDEEGVESIVNEDIVYKSSSEENISESETHSTEKPRDLNMLIDINIKEKTTEKNQYKKDMVHHIYMQETVGKEIDVTSRSAIVDVDDTFLEHCTESSDHNDTQPEYNNMLCFDNVEREVIIGDEEEPENPLEVSDSRANIQISILRSLGLLDDDMSTAETTEIVIERELSQEMYPDTDISSIHVPYIPADSDYVVLHEDHLLTESVDEETMPRDILSYSEIEELLSSEYPIESLQHLADDGLAVPSKPIDPETPTLSSYLIYKNAKTYDERQIVFTPLQTVDHDYVATNIVVDTEDRFCFANVKLPIQCDDCPESFSDWVPYVVHSLVWKHYGSCYKCNKPSVCGAKLCNKDMLNLQYSIKRDQQAKAPVVCQTCGAKVRKDNLRTHNRKHQTDLPYKCELCPYRSRHLASLRVHFRTHTDEKPYACDQCDLRFRSSSNLLVHKRGKHSEKRFECECGRKFCTLGMLRSHKKKDHVEVKRVPCRLCDEVFDSSKKWKAHKNEVHKFEKMPMGRTPLYMDDKFQKQQKTIKCELGMYTSHNLRKKPCKLP